ncbi:hypothetical protein MHU86_11340 [Fragilaria crotonensis]|nr:hypothetical protein MHU86_11340 [Fragilaria crotonensis]
MQVRLNDVKINDTPRFLTDNPDELTHSIVIPMADSDEPFVIPLSLKGVSSSFPTRKPTIEEYETLPHLTLTSDEPEYDPHDTSFAEQEDALTKYVSETGDRIGAAPRPHRICMVSNTSLAQQTNIDHDGVRLSLQSISVALDEACYRSNSAAPFRLSGCEIKGSNLKQSTLRRTWVSTYTLPVER